MTAREAPNSPKRATPAGNIQDPHLACGKPFPPSNPTIPVSAFQQLWDRQQFSQEPGQSPDRAPHLVHNHLPSKHHELVTLPTTSPTSMPGTALQPQLRAERSPGQASTLHKPTRLLPYMSPHHILPTRSLLQRLSPMPAPASAGPCRGR